MSIFLLGGGWDRDAEASTWGGFVAEVRERAAHPRVGLVVMGVDEESRAYHQRYLEVLGRTGLAKTEVEVTRVPEGGTCPADALEGVDGLVVGGGPTPAYLTALAPLAEQVRALVASGVPYAGFSAGSAIAATHAVVGGWRLDGVPVCPQDSDEGLDELAVRPGLGLVEGGVDVHAAAWGNLSRLVAAVEAGLVPRGVAVDEDTCLRLEADGSDPTSGRVSGAGRVWWVDPAPSADRAVVVRRS